jgi:replicative DNA helicase
MSNPLFTAKLADADLEQAVLGACLVDNRLIPMVASTIGGGWYNDKNCKLFERMQELYGKLGAVDAVLMMSADHGKLPWLDTDIADLLNNAALGIGLEGHLERLVELDRKRSVAHLSMDLVNELNQGKESAELLEKVQDSLNKIYEHSGVNLKYGDVWAEEYYAHMQHRLTSEKIGLGFPAIDVRLTEGLVPGNMSVIGARPTMGKSAFAANILRNLCQRGVGCLWLTYEMSAMSQMDRLVTLETGIPLQRVLALRELPEEEQDRIFEAAEHIKTWPVMLDDRRVVWWQDVVSAVLRAKSRMKVQVVFVDMFDKLGDFFINDQPRAIEAKLNAVGELAMRQGVHFCLVAQISRSAVRREDRRPELHDLKGSGGWEQKADLALLLHRERAYQVGRVDDGVTGHDICEVFIAKQRNGPIGWARFLYGGGLLTFTEPDLDMDFVGQNPKKGVKNRW